MKRSEINRHIQMAKDLFDAHCFKLPKWGYWPPEKWRDAGPEAAEIKECALGWDVTDFGRGEFEKQGLLLFTARNGNLKRPGNVKTYAEKIMMVQEKQVTPLHFHWAKMEDIINRGGGRLVIQLFASDKSEALDKTSDVRVSVDGIVRVVKAGDTVSLSPGESISLTRGLYHKFWAEGGPTMVGEVSMVNDDSNDNRFHEQTGRFPKIEEDEAPLHLLCNEYPDFA